MTDSDMDSKNSSKGPAPTNFIRNMISQDLAIDKHGGRVHTRFPPEPNGYLHIGHAKSICLNFSVAEENNGFCNLRFDDTNPTKESQEYVDAIKDNITWLGFHWNGEVRYSSSYFEQLYGFAEQLILKSKAFVCNLSAEEAREYRGTLTEAGRNSPGRERSIKENQDLFTRMRKGDFADGQYTLRAKIDMESPNINMRDPVLYRIRHFAHHQTGDKWCIYPTYDYTHCISDAIESITHSLCTLEFEDHRPLYDWILQNLSLDSLERASDLTGTEYQYVLPEQTEFAKLRLNYTVIGKRNLREMVESEVVEGWDDPRMPTLAGMRRRGFTPASIRNFCESIGVSRSESIVDLSMLEHAIREDLDRHAPRAMCILDPLKVVLTNLQEEETEYLDLANHPKIDSMGRRSVPLTREIFIDRSDFLEQPPAGFKRLTQGGEVRLRGAYVIRCDEVVKDDSGGLQQLCCSIDKATLGKKPEGRKVKGVIHWVSAKYGLPVRVRLYDRLFTIEHPESKEVDNCYEYLNPDSLIELEGCIAEPSILAKGAFGNFQFEREGYFCIDSIDSTPELPVFNRTITLRDSWSGR
ncbi:MAG: glutamine--tRNA ligase [Gammaproteobacteria bacterium]|nr:glutamine--tRNA ligase [Gammaproteobacteria bacterium]